MNNAEAFFPQKVTIPKAFGTRLHNFAKNCLRSLNKMNSLSLKQHFVLTAHIRPFSLRKKMECRGLLAWWICITALLLALGFQLLAFCF